MGAGASADTAKFRETLNQNFLQGKPLDASDITTLEDALDEIRKLRTFASKALNSTHSNEAIARGAGSMIKGKKNGRAAVVAKQNFDSSIPYEKKSFPKSGDAKKLILAAITPNILFKACSGDEFGDIVDAFEMVEVKDGAYVINQGEQGEHFYVVEDGSLDIFVKMGGSDAKVGVPLVKGAAFGELALMYNTPRAATIKASMDCKLWAIDRNTFRSIVTHYKYARMKMYMGFLKKVQIGGKALGDVLSATDLDHMALALDSDSFKAGDVIIREGEKGDNFYIIEDGEVDVQKDGKSVTNLTTGQFFGEKALLSEDVRQATCIAKGALKVLCMAREDFVLMLGDMQDLLDGKSTDEVLPGQEVQGSKKVQFSMSDLEVGRTLGIGAFGRVKLVKVKTDPESPTFALKCQSKRAIVENGLQDHVMNEKNIMAELDHPFILKYFCSMKDDRYIYFVLELLLGGELFTFLRNETQFSETWSRFYSASVLMAFCQIHGRKIAYRDLKPENLVMDADGFLKIVDFGLAKVVSGKTWTLCGTPDYLAPEIILNEGHDLAVDYWALGVLIYEMTAGMPPFYADDPMEVYEKILSGHVSIPSHFSKSLSDITKKLLKTYQSKRLGNTKGGTGAVMKHKWYAGFDWDALLNRKIDVPIKPRVNGNDDASNFDHYADDDGEVEVCNEWDPDLTA
jgi:CRP-like cAMP-binding protein